MSTTNDLIEQHLDEFYQWIGKTKYDEAMEWSPQYHGDGDDDHEQIIEAYVNGNPELIHEFINQLPQA